MIIPKGTTLGNEYNDHSQWYYSWEWVQWSFPRVLLLGMSTNDHSQWYYSWEWYQQPKPTCCFRKLYMYNKQQATATTPKQQMIIPKGTTLRNEYPWSFPRVLLLGMSTMIIPKGTTLGNEYQWSFPRVLLLGMSTMIIPRGTTLGNEYHWSFPGVLLLGMIPTT